ncbi:glycosyltransferase [Bacillus thuringiensis]|uniref:glycosyltransferase family 2 protein n=1 Tax=Bacillus thuringiensis TaxID=1428 RepID=UPI0010ABC5F7|nr:glycosyltransferase family A protein [Bacillus thuringiensis]TJZ99685.1 glycosyltransferase [Bacillus thuringiensis]
MEFISIVIPLYNKESYVERAIKSILNQTIQNFEIIVVDDGSEDKSCNIVRNFQDPRIQLIQQKHSGVAAARNRGIESARANIIAFLDADDEWRPTFLETMCNLKKKYPNGGAYATSYEIRLKNNRKLIPKIKHIPPFPWEGIISNYTHAVLGDLPLISSAIAIPTTTFKKLGKFPVGAQLGEDQDMWFRIAQKYAIVYSHTPQAIYYRGLPHSLCTNLKIIEPYPIIKTVENNLKLKTKENEFYLKEYLAKLQLDFSKRLLQANKLSTARDFLYKCNTKTFTTWKFKLLMLYYLKAIFSKTFK